MSGIWNSPDVRVLSEWRWFAGEPKYAPQVQDLSIKKAVRFTSTHRHPRDH